jgi:hypothetical protein
VIAQLEARLRAPFLFLVWPMRHKPRQNQCGATENALNAERAHFVNNDRLAGTLNSLAKVVQGLLDSITFLFAAPQIVSELRGYSPRSTRH